MRTSARIWLAIGATVLVGLVGVIPLSMAMITFLRERMHLYCSFARMGSDDPGSYLCADGIGYILPGLVLWFWFGSLLLATAITAAVFLPRPPLAIRALAIIGMAGLVSTVTVSVLADSGRHPAGEIPADTWVTVMAVPAVLFGLACVALILAAVSHSRTLGRVSLWVAFALVLAATVVEPTLAFGTVPVLIAAGIALVLAHRRAASPEAQAPERSVSAH